MDSDIYSRRRREHEKYERAYKNSGYRMGVNRRRVARDVLRRLQFKGSYLDVGAGRGEMVEYASSIGFDPVVGVEVVSYLLGGDVIFGEAYDLPFEDKQFNVVTSFDVFEHLLPEDTEKALSEVNRVSKQAVILAIPSHPSGINSGDNYHVNLRGKHEWLRLIDQYLDGNVSMLPRPDIVKTETFLIIKE